MAEAHQTESKFPPQKIRATPSSNSINDGVQLSAALVENTNKDGLEEPPKRKIEGPIKTVQSADKSVDAEDFLDGSDTRIGRPEDEKSAEQNPQSKPKDKAAARQAKSERRSKKRKPILAAPTTTVAERPRSVEHNLLTRDDQEQDQKQKTLPSNPPNPDTKQRFIVFVGNLPYTATTASIQSHFSKLQPFTVRHSTNRETGQSRGFAFLEFEGYDKMKTCLKLYHHSLFETITGRVDFVAGEKKNGPARKINVELTAGGGGGKSAARKERIRGKNKKLDDERERARIHREKEEAAANNRKKNAGLRTGANATQATNAESENGNIHPSRRKRLET